MFRKKIVEPKKTVSKKLVVAATATTVIGAGVATAVVLKRRKRLLAEANEKFIEEAKRFVGTVVELTNDFYQYVNEVVYITGSDDSNEDKVKKLINVIDTLGVESQYVMVNGGCKNLRTNEVMPLLNISDVLREFDEIMTSFVSSHVTDSKEEEVVANSATTSSVKKTHVKKEESSLDTIDDDAEDDSDDDVDSILDFLNNLNDDSDDENSSFSEDSDDEDEEDSEYVEDDENSSFSEESDDEDDEEYSEDDESDSMSDEEIEEIFHKKSEEHGLNSEKMDEYIKYLISIDNIIDPIFNNVEGEASEILLMHVRDIIFYIGVCDTNARKELLLQASHLFKDMDPNEFDKEADKVDGFISTIDKKYETLLDDILDDHDEMVYLSELSRLCTEYITDVENGEEESKPFVYEKDDDDTSDNNQKENSTDNDGNKNEVSDEEKRKLQNDLIKPDVLEAERMDVIRKVSGIVDKKYSDGNPVDKSTQTMITKFTFHITTLAFLNKEMMELWTERLIEAIERNFNATKLKVVLDDMHKSNPMLRLLLSPIAHQEYSRILAILVEEEESNETVENAADTNGNDDEPVAKVEV